MPFAPLTLPRWPSLAVGQRLHCVLSDRLDERQIRTRSDPASYLRRNVVKEGNAQTFRPTCLLTSERVEDARSKRKKN